MNSETVVIQRDEKWQPCGIMVFADFYAIADCVDPADWRDFIDTIEVMPMCKEARAALAENGRDGYLGQCPAAWMRGGTQ